MKESIMIAFWISIIISQAKALIGLAQAVAGAYYICGVIFLFPLFSSKDRA